MSVSNAGVHLNVVETDALLASAVLFDFRIRINALLLCTIERYAGSIFRLRKPGIHRYAEHVIEWHCPGCCAGVDPHLLAGRFLLDSCRGGTHCDCRE
jgi:hypothetical protein